jgi:hypothetical protein
MDVYELVAENTALGQEVSELRGTLAEAQEQIRSLV